MPGSRIAEPLRSLGSALAAAVGQLSTRRMVLTAMTVVALVAATLMVRLPTATELRDWSVSMGPWLPAAFLAAHILVTVLPFPRTAFTLAAGLLFGPPLGIALAVTASTVSALIALALVRAAGWQLGRLVRHDSVDRVDARLRERGGLAVLSLRLVPVIPFAPLNYAAGASGVRVTPYALATIAGLLPGTSAVVILGDALTGHVSPLLVLVSVCTGLVGLALLAHEIRQYRRHHHGPQRSGETQQRPTARSDRLEN